MCPMILYYQTQFIKVSCTTDQEIALGTFKTRGTNSAEMNRKYHDNPESQKQYEKREYKRNSELKNREKRKSF